MIKEQVEALVNLKDVAVGLSIIIGKSPMEGSLNKDVMQETNCVLMAILEEMESYLKKSDVIYKGNGIIVKVVD